MKCLLDTNILVSAALFPDGAPARAFMRAVNPPFKAVVCDYSMDEMRRVFNKKFPHRLPEYDRFVSMTALSVEIVFTPPDEEAQESEGKIRDVKDRPILRTAIAVDADVIITGDKDFLEAGLAKPRAINAADFLKL